MRQRAKEKSIGHNMGICKSWADVSCASTFVFQFGFIHALVRGSRTKHKLQYPIPWFVAYEA